MQRLICLIMIILTLTNLKAGTSIWLVGDSTVCNYGQDRYPQMGWGQALQNLTSENATIKNRAVGGRSTKSFIDEKRWEKILNELQKDDYVIIQFGHNDQKSKKPRIYAPAEGLYQELLKKYISETRAKGAHPILVTSVCRRYFRDNKIKNTLGKYPEAMKKVAKETSTPVVDLNQISLGKFTELGPEETKNIFLHLNAGEYENYPDGKKDNSHFQEYGARQIAGWVLEDMQKQKLPVTKFFE